MANLASPWRRLGAYFIDVLVFVLASVPFFVAYFLTVEEQKAGQRNAADALLIAWLGGLLLVLTLIVVYFWLLATRGQTLGKMALKLRIVKQAHGENGGFVTNVLMRFIVGQAILGNFVPFYSLVDILFIFREDRRCIHDLIAGTLVVQA